MRRVPLSRRPDIRPELYGQSPQITCKKPDPARDDFELRLLVAALKARRPILCIGRGMQLLNVAFGGTLVQELKGKQEYPHQDFFNRYSATHPIELDPDSLVSRVLGTDAVTVNSLHHQAADIIGEGLWIAADSPEGISGGRWRSMIIPSALRCSGIRNTWQQEFRSSTRIALPCEHPSIPPSLLFFL